VTPVELSHLIAQDIARNGDSLKWHGRPIAECLRVPEQRRFLDASNRNEPVTLWLVFTESPESEGGYSVVYSEQESAFGLVTSGALEPVLLGFYGGFVEALHSM
jgi:hypothetical protein